MQKEEIEDLKKELAGYADVDVKVYKDTIKENAMFKMWQKRQDAGSTELEKKLDEYIEKNKNKERQLSELRIELSNQNNFYINEIAKLVEAIDRIKQKLSK